MTFAEKLKIIYNAKQDIRNAIMVKGVEVNAWTPFSQYADKILEISSGSGVSDDMRESFADIRKAIIAKGVDVDINTPYHLYDDKIMAIKQYSDKEMDAVINDIKEAIISKGVGVHSSVAFSEYGNKIREIKVGNNSGLGHIIGTPAGVYYLSANVSFSNSVLTNPKFYWSTSQRGPFVELTKQPMKLLENTTIYIYATDENGMNTTNIYRFDYIIKGVEVVDYYAYDNDNLKIYANDFVSFSRSSPFYSNFMDKASFANIPLQYGRDDVNITMISKNR